MQESAGYEGHEAGRLTRRQNLKAPLLIGQEALFEHSGITLRELAQGRVDKVDSRTDLLVYSFIHRLGWP